jgi:hypothetical protein
VILAVSLIFGARANAAGPAAPIFIRAPIENEAVPVCLPDGSLKVFFISRPDGLKMCSLSSTDGGLTWSDRKEEFDLPAAGYHSVQVILEKGGELVAFFHVFRGDPNGRKCAVDCFYDGWVARTTGQRSKWTKPQRVFEGYIGALRGIIQTTSGRIIVPFGCEVPGKGPTLPTGSEVMTVMYSDDAGNTWQKSPSQIQAPCDPEYNNASWDGACEPSIVQLKDGRIWILMRTQANYQYETLSDDDGIHFQYAKRSRFPSPNAPSNMLRLKDGRIVLLWNNTANPPKFENKDVYGGRDALHIAISSDEGKTWRGFRELFRDPLRDSAPPHRGDRGTSYATAIETTQGKIVITAGLGEARRRIILVDPAWIEQTESETHFEQGLDDWCVFKWHGPLEGVWRDRVAGPELIAHPGKPDHKVLHLRRPDEKDPDGASWNFPAGFKGELKLRLLLPEGSQGGTIALGDRFFDPTDVNGESKAMFFTRFYPDGEYCTGKLPLKTWCDVSLKWGTDQQLCEVSIDDKHVMSLPQLEPTQNGISYLRLRSAAEKPDKIGFLIESVAAKVEAIR